MIEKTETIEVKLDRIFEILKGKKVLLAFSGGMDSSFLLLAAQKYANKVTPVFFSGPIFSKEEKEDAKKFCSTFGIPLQIKEMDPLSDSNFKANPPDRCYYCKKLIMVGMNKLKNEKGYDFIIEGTNRSDISGHRPGYQALKELEILSPLLDAGFTKDDIREGIQFIKKNLNQFFSSNLNNEKVSNVLGELSRKPANPCLCSRMEYGMPIDEENLRRIEEAEFFLKNEFNIKILRVRLHSNLQARIEVLEKDLSKIIMEENRKRIINKFKALGFRYISLDLEGFRSGSLNI